MTDEELTKVHIDLPNHWGTGGESLWARAMGGDRYRIENIPFYAYDLNLGDIVEARAAAPDLKPEVARIVERSGHQTLRVFFAEAVADGARLTYLQSLADLQVSFERATGRYVALDLKPGVETERVRARLDRAQEDGILEYETCEARVPGSFDDAPGEATETR